MPRPSLGDQLTTKLLLYSRLRPPSHVYRDEDDDDDDDDDEDEDEGAKKCFKLAKNLVC